MLKERLNQEDAVADVEGASRVWRRGIYRRLKDNGLLGGKRLLHGRCWQSNKHGRAYRSGCRMQIGPKTVSDSAVGDHPSLSISERTMAAHG